MEQISIEKPVEVSISVTEKDDYLPSFKTTIKCRINHPTGILIYEADDIWFQCSVWDKFIERLSTVNEVNGLATLANMSEHFIISIGSKDKQLYFEIKCKEVISNTGTINIDYSTKIDLDSLDSIKRAFNELDKWW
jgi:hypothetical protein